MGINTGTVTDAVRTATSPALFEKALTASAPNYGTVETAIRGILKTAVATQKVISPYPLIWASDLMHKIYNQVPHWSKHFPMPAKLHYRETENPEFIYFPACVTKMCIRDRMDIARHGIFRPEHFSFYDLICIFMAVMVTDIILLDMFNSLGMPTSTTVSMVFELLGATFVVALIKMAGGSDLGFNDLLNTEKALSVILGIFLSVAIAFVFGTLVQCLSLIHI